MDGRSRNEPRVDWRVWRCAEGVHKSETRKQLLVGATDSPAVTHKPKTSSISSNM